MEPLSRLWSRPAPWSDPCSSPGTSRRSAILRHHSPEARIGLTWLDGPLPPLALLEELGAEYWNPMFGLVTTEGVDAVHLAGHKVSTWTVDEPRDMDRVVDAGVDAVVSNRIADLVAFLHH